MGDVDRSRRIGRPDEGHGGGGDQRGDERGAEPQARAAA